MSVAISGRGASVQAGSVCARFVFALLMLGCGESNRSEASSPAPAVAQVFDALVVAQVSGSPAAMYLTVTNPTDVPDTLTAVETAAAERAELHRTMERGAMVHMEPVGTIELPARGEIRMEPGGYHVMLVGTRDDLAPGDTVEAALILGRAGRLGFRASVITYADLAEGLSGGADP